MLVLSLFYTIDHHCQNKLSHLKQKKTKKDVSHNLPTTDGKKYVCIPRAWLTKTTAASSEWCTNQSVDYFNHRHSSGKLLEIITVKAIIHTCRRCKVVLNSMSKKMSNTVTFPQPGQHKLTGLCSYRATGEGTSCTNLTSSRARYPPRQPPSDSERWRSALKRGRL